MSLLSTIKLGSSGDDVKVLQYLLGVAPIKEATGVFDDVLKDVVELYQRNHSLGNDGIVGSQTWASIVSTLPIVSTSKNKKSAYTCAIQILLNGVDVDGVYGTQTKKAVAAFQSASKLTADGITGPKTWQLLILGKLQNVEKGASTVSTEVVEYKQPVDYKQGDSRWGKKMYSSHGDTSQTMASSGCGPTSMADIVATLKDPSITPYDLAQLSMKWGDRSASNGTNWSFFKHIKEHFCFSKETETSSLATVRSCLDTGGYVVVSFGPSKWTKGGHYCVIWKYDASYYYINDPASSSAERKKGTEAEVTAARKRFFCFWK